MKKLILPLVILLILGGIYGYYEYNRPMKSISGAKADVSIGSSELLTAFESDETVANGKYLDKIIEVSGKVASVETTDGITQVAIETQNPLSSVVAELEQNQNFSNIKSGDLVYVKGKCTGYLSDVILNQAIIVTK